VADVAAGEFVPMLKHMVVLAVAVATSLSAAKELMKVSAAHAAPVAISHVAASNATPDAPSSAAQVSRGRDGHYWAEAEVDGHWIHCLIDTGASTVALTRADAQRLGLDTEELNYNVPVNTANGTTHAAPVQLAYVAVSGARVEQVPAMVVHDGLSASLLGMSYLGRLSRFEATPAAIILRR
jgi:aspartyl protease family protein